MAIRAIGSESRPLSAASTATSLFPSTNNTDGYRPLASRRPPNAAAVGALSPAGSTPPSYRPVPKPPATASGPSAAAALAADRGSGPLAEAVRKIELSDSNVNIGALISPRAGKSGAHFLIPAPPPAWSGAGAASSAQQRSAFKSAGTSGEMVTVVASPRSTHHSLKMAQRTHELALLESAQQLAATLPLHSDSGSGARQLSPRPHTSDVTVRTVVVLPLADDEVEVCREAALAAPAGVSAAAAGVGGVQASTAITHLAHSRPNTTQSGGRVCTAVAVVDVPPGGTRPTVCDARRGLTLTSRAVDLNAGEQLVAKAVREAEMEAPQLLDPSNNIGIASKSGARAAPPVSITTLPMSDADGTATGICVDLGRDRALCSSPRLGHKSEALNRSATCAQQRVQFSVQMAPVLGIEGALTSPRDAPLGTALSPPTAAPPSRGGLFGSLDRAEQQAAPFLTTTERFGPCNMSPRRFGHCPPVGHYTPKHGSTDHRLIRNVFLHGRASYSSRSGTAPVSPRTPRARSVAASASTSRAGKEAVAPSPDIATAMPPARYRVRTATINPAGRAPSGVDGPAGAAGTTPFGAFNEAARSHAVRIPSTVAMDRTAGRGQASGWEREPRDKVANASAWYTGGLRGDHCDASLAPKVFVDMDRQPGRAMPLHSHQAALEGGGGQPLCSLDLLPQPPDNSDARVTSKFRNTLGSPNNAIVTMHKQSPRKPLVHAAHNSTADKRADLQAVVFNGSTATRSGHNVPPIALQTPRPNAAVGSTCARDSYDVDYDDGRGHLVLGLRAKNDLISPRTPQADFNRMGSHEERGSFTKAAEGRMLVDTHGLGDSEIQSAFAHTKTRTNKNVDFTKLAPRRDELRPLIESCADPARVYPKEVLEDRLTGNPFMAQHVSREARQRVRAPKSAFLGDPFMDIPANTSYDAERCKGAKNAVSLARETNRSAPCTASARSAGTACDAEIGPGKYSANVDALSRPLPAVFRRDKP